MRKFLYKEFYLAMPLPLFFLTVLGMLTMIPNYPICIGAFYSLIAIFITYSIQKDNRDIEFSLTLPVTRKCIVSSKISIIILIQMLSLCFSAVGAIIANFIISPNGNIVGSDPNIAFFGMCFIAFAIFNIIFIPWFFKTGYKINLPIFVAILGFVASFVIYEAIVAIFPSLNHVLDTLDAQYFAYQSIILVIGIIVYSTTIFACYKLSLKNLEKVNI